MDLGFATTTPGHLVPLLDGGAILIDQLTGFKHFGMATRSLRFLPADGTWRDIVPPFIAVEDPSSGETFVSPGTARSGPVVAPLADGRVMLAGGNPLTASGMGASLSSAEAYDPVTGAWEDLPDMPEARSYAPAVALPDGSVLVVGGWAWADLATTRLTSAVRLAFGP